MANVDNYVVTVFISYWIFAHRIIDNLIKREATMDIFTTALTRVVPVPIKPADLKVKAPEKTSPTNDVSDDIEGLEDPALYFNKPISKKGLNKEKESEKEKNKHHDLPEVIEASEVPEDNTGQHIDVFEDSESSPPAEKDGKPHLDLFV